MANERMWRAAAAAVVGCVFGAALSYDISGAILGAAVGIGLAEFTELPLLLEIQTWRVRQSTDVDLTETPRARFLASACNR